MMGFLRKTLLKSVVVILLIIFSSNPCPAQVGEPDRDLGRFIEPFLPENTEWALTVIDLETGEQVVETGNSLRERLVPASLMKLLITGAVLEYAEQGGTVNKVVTVRKAVTVKGKKRHRSRRKTYILARQTVEIRDKLELMDILRDMNVHSRNSTAQNLAVSLGERRFGAPGTRSKGNRAVCTFLNSLDLPPREALIADGCGLDRGNRMSAGFIAYYLYQVSKKPWFDSFRDTLPRPGMEGTVKRIGYTDQRFRVKTGSLNDVFALAGYGVNAGGREFSFAFIVNSKKGRVSDRMHSRGELLRLLAEGVPPPTGVVQQ
ncbi:MAG TPA: D-alanyl-D-alanine carboxypeptidase [Geobacteraceae bacterium]|nr:D-alanyl-D-alanine carboxypeptidase [Geobacteraceae bacterium]